MAVSRDENVDRSTKTPALRALQNHSKHVRKEVRYGFRSFDELMLWFLDVSKFTLGWIPDEFALRIVSDPYTVHALMREAARPPGATVPADEEQTAQQLIEGTIAPAFNSARGWLRSQAQDHEEEVDADRQEHTALIPRVDHVAGVQRRLIEGALNVDDDMSETNHNGPIDDRRDVSDWVDDLSYATQGFAPNDLSNVITQLGSDWRYQLTKSRSVKLRQYIARDLLPPMNRAIVYAAEQGMEQKQNRRGSNTEASIS